MATFVVAHGAWSASWAWWKMRPLMQSRGHRFVVPCYTGLGERRHLLDRSVTLETHILDVIGAIKMEDLRDIVLVGHSYGGMVATGVADRVRERVAQLVYLDAFVPQDGQSLLDLQPPEHRARVEALAANEGDGWLLPPQPSPPDTAPEDVAWMTPRRFSHPIETFRAPLHLEKGGFPGPRTYIFCTKVGPGDAFRQFAVRAMVEPGWRYLELGSSHNPHITMPEQLMAMLDGVAGGGGRS